MRTRDIVALARQVTLDIWEDSDVAAAERGLSLPDRAWLLWWVEMLTSSSPAGWALVMA